jgi:hypothetical protein
MAVVARDSADVMKLEAALEPYLSGALTADDMIQALGRKYRVIDAALAATKRGSDAAAAAQRAASPRQG